MTKSKTYTFTWEEENEEEFDVGDAISNGMNMIAEECPIIKIKCVDDKS